MSDESYPGGKGATFRQIVNQIPPHQVYIEPFLGGGAVLRHKRPAAVNIGVDLLPAALARTVRAVEPWTVATTARNGGAAGAGGLVPHLVKVTPTARYEWYCMDAVRFLAAYPFTGEEFVYCDPPYLMETRRDQTRQLYLFEFDRNQHRDLLDCITDLPCNVAISGYESSLYDLWLGDWRTITYPSQTRGGTTATEWLWMNYPEPTELHDSSFLGDDYRERERIRKRRNRWVARLRKLDALERQALLDAIAEAGLLRSTPARIGEEAGL